MKKTKFTFNSFVDDTMKEIIKDEKALRSTAARLIKRKIVRKISDDSDVSLPGEPPSKDKGNLIKGLEIKSFDHVTMVRIRKPGQHGNPLEHGSTKKGTNLHARPFFFITFKEERLQVRKILRQEVLK